MDVNQVKVYDTETVSQQYTILSSGRTKDERQRANRYILEFMQSEQAWTVAQSLLQQTQSHENQFIGATALYQKLKVCFDSDPLKDSQVRELVENIFQMLKNMCENPNKSRVVFERLCMCIAYITIKTVNGAWPDSITSVISFGQQNSAQCFIGLLILKHTAMAFDQYSFDHRTTTMIEAYLRSNLNVTLDFINQVITAENLPQECYLEAFSTAKHWCAYSTKTFIPHEQFITNIFKLLDNPKVAPKIVNIIKKLLVKSKYVKLLENVSYDMAFNEIPATDMRFIELVIEWLQNNRDKQVSIGLQPNVNDDEDAQRFAVKYTEVLVHLCSNYEILLIKDTPVSATLFQLLIDCAASRNLKISQLSLEFWDEFKETINNNLSDDQLTESMFKPYADIIKILLVQCRKSEGSELRPDSDQDEQEQYERGLSVAKYREYACDVYFKAFFLLRKIYKQQGSTLVFDLLLADIRNMQNPYVMESGLYAAKSILDAFENTEENIKFVSEVFTAIIQSNGAAHNPVVAKGSVLFIHEASSFLKYLTPQMKQILELLILTSQTFPQLQDIVIKTIFETCSQCKSSFGDAEFTMLYSYLAQSYKHLNNTQVGMLMEAVCTVCSILESDKLPQAVAQTSQIAVQLLQNIDINQLHNIDRDDLQKALIMLSGCVRAIDYLPAVVVKSAIFPIISNIWNNLCSILEIKYNDGEVVILVCELFQKLVKALNIEMTPLFGSMTKALLSAFQSKPDNIKCLRVYAFSCSILGRQPEVLQVIASTYDQICSVIVGQLFNQKDGNNVGGMLQNLENVNIDIIRCSAELMHKVAELDINILINSQYFHQMIVLFHETLITINAKETNTELVLFFTFLIQSRNGLPIVLKYLELITSSLLCSITKQFSSLLDKISNALVVLMNTAEAQGIDQALRQAMGAALQNNLFKALSDKTKLTFINILFAFKSQRQKVKLALVNFNGLTNGVMGEDCMLGLELEANELAKLQQAQKLNLQNGVTQVISLE